jgi:hypothetical protein
MNIPTITSKKDLSTLVNAIVENTTITKDENNFLTINGEITNIQEF